MLSVKQEVTFDDLRNMLWGSNYESVLDCVENHNMEQEFMDYLEEEFDYDVVDLVQLNDYIRDEWENIYSELGISEDDEEEE